ncbi:MAG: threonine synthase [Omnitrophica bacterium RIFCSPLOWO2_02_FULL_45_16]|nr:MAG: threonine synthase [Omnitrophica bacterium RIFCSPHIGHO2_02_FULL_46_20]OGW94736.1 MAG: threonine synthase [Omnitrophica bacterium RIFCSPLOWO2_12_FULL_45_13]OGW94904.1 MAG: threonine synthase [Omnitrophica bacterium RIFCSPLOWO2_01_FULL_45_24]OGX01180.1 MAG: threonine synthase [Omnitrophica bacterium RIFCSPLOWO2_02_FULL_45_16]
MWKGIIEEYRKFLPVTDKTPVVSLCEGNTPLICAQTLSKLVSDEVYPHTKKSSVGVYLKYEGLNPTASFKDRGMTVAISKAVEEGRKAVMCASTGNTSASAAAYAARAGIKCVVLIPEGAITLGKLSQALIHGAKVIAIKGNFDDALRIVREICEKHPITLVNSINPYRIEGQKTGSFEICDSLGDAPDFHAIPVGNAGNITAYWKGYKEYKAANISKRLPKMLGFQAEGAAPIVLGHPVKEPRTIATAIKIGNPASWKQAEAARDESGGLIDMVSDDEILAAYKLLASMDGIFVEPASAASVAGILKLAKKGFFNVRRQKPDEQRMRIVCVLTGHGLKDPDRAIASVDKPKVLEPNVDLVLKEMGL